MGRGAADEPGRDVAFCGGLAEEVTRGAAFSWRDARPLKARDVETARSVVVAGVTRDTERHARVVGCARESFGTIFVDARAARDRRNSAGTAYGVALRAAECALALRAVAA